MTIYDATLKVTPQDRYHLLVDDLDGRIVCVSTSHTVINHVATIYGFHAVFNMAVRRADPEFSLKESWHWSCTKSHYMNHLRRAEVVLARNPVAITEEQLGRYQLVREKCGALQFVVSDITVKRRRQWTDLPMQDMIYTAKYNEAKEILASVGAPPALDYPFVRRHADYRQCDLKAAAKEIVFEHNMMKEKMADTELVRITYTDRIMKAETVAQLEEIIGDYQLRVL